MGFPWAKEDPVAAKTMQVRKNNARSILIGYLQTIKDYVSVNCCTLLQRSSFCRACEGSFSTSFSHVPRAKQQGHQSYRSSDEPVDCSSKISTQTIRGQPEQATVVPQPASTNRPHRCCVQGLRKSASPECDQVNKCKNPKPIADWGAKPWVRVCQLLRE